MRASAARPSPPSAGVGTWIGAGYGTSGNFAGPTAPACPSPSALSAWRIFSGVHRDLVHSHAHGVVDGVGHGRRNREERPLADLLRAERAVGIGILDQVRHRPRTSPSWSGSCTRASTGTCGRRCALASVGTPSPPSSPRPGPCTRSPRPGRSTSVGLMHLPTSCAIQTFGTVYDAGLGIHLDLDDRRRVGVRGRGAHARSAIAPGRGRRRVGARPSRACRTAPRRAPRPPRTTCLSRDWLHVEDASAREHHALGGDLELLRDAAATSISRARSAAWIAALPVISVTRRGVGAEVDRRQVGVARDDPDVERIDAEHLRHDGGEDRVGALADVRRAAENRDAAAAVELQLHAGLGHRRSSRSAAPRRRGTRSTRARARGPAEAFRGARFQPDAATTLSMQAPEPHRADAQEVRRQRVRRGGDARSRISAGSRPRSHGDLVELRPRARSAAAACRARAWDRTAACS